MKFSATLRSGLIIPWILVVHGQATAQLDDITRGELALTPEFCQDVQAIPVTGWTKTAPSPRTPKWLAIMGETFWAMHHYCWALIGLQRAGRAGTSPDARTFAIGVAISDYYYVVKNSPPDFVLLPEVHYRIGEARVLLGDYVPALAEFAKSRALKPDYWPPYVGEANILMKVGKRKEAQDLLNMGLKLMPDQPNLRAALDRAKDSPSTGPKAKQK